MQDALSLLKNTFKLSSFRPGQEAVITALLQGRSALAVFPTGGGKSLCYQLPALMLDGLTLVVSPLIALMKDQVDALQALGIPAARMDSSLSKDDVQAIFNDLHNQTVKLLYVSPERLKNERFVQRLGNLRIALMAIDEAHCISEWGHNFRPDYLTLTNLAKKLRVERVLALTATATPGVARDICTQFSIAPEDHIQTSFARPNLHLRVTACEQDERLPLVIARLRKQPADAATIIYVTLQKTAEEVSAAINAAGLVAGFYHAGLKDEEREQIQNQFMRGELAVVVATIAFGMGIDKSNIRAVYHFNLPKSIENYVQEIGRAGRDGLPALCEMFAVGDDIRVLQNFTYGDTPADESLRALVNYILAFEDRFDISVYELSQRFDLRPLVLNTALTYLELHGVILAEAPFYTQYKLHFLKPMDEIVAQFDAQRAEFLRRLFSAGHAGRKWLTLDMLTLSDQLSEPRERVVAALDYFVDKNWIELAVANLRQSYKRGAASTTVEESESLCAILGDLFAEREARDIQRIDQVLAYANNPECLSLQIVQYFGEQSEQRCGICSHCKSHCKSASIIPVAPVAQAPISNTQRALIQQVGDEQHPALQQTRQLARFLCGLPSPATTRAGLKKHQAFGALADTSFRTLLDHLSALQKVS